MKKLPKIIRENPFVEMCDWGSNQNSDYKYWVDLKEGYMFRWYESGSKGFMTIQDFKDAEIVERVWQ